jgi:hypothetical protein
LAAAASVFGAAAGFGNGAAGGALDEHAASVEERIKAEANRREFMAACKFVDRQQR